MKRTLALTVVLALFSGLALAEDLKKLSLDDASAIGTTITTDSKVKTEGKGSVKITTICPATVCLGEISDLDVENAELVYKAKVKSELNGFAYLEMWVHVGDGRYFSKGLNSQITGKTDWKSIQTSFLFQKGQKPDRVTLSIVINGTGTVWVDDVVLSKEPLK